MTAEACRFCIDESTEKDIRAHLLCCDAQFSPPLSRRVDIEEYSRKIRERGLTFEAWNGDTLVGLVAAYLDIPDRRCFITDVSVREEFTGKGIAESLMNECLGYARHSSISSIALEVSPDSRPAIKLYEKLGFRLVERRRNTLLMRYELAVLRDSRLREDP